MTRERVSKGIAIREKAKARARTSMWKQKARKTWPVLTGLF